MCLMSRCNYPETETGTHELINAISPQVLSCGGKLCQFTGYMWQAGIKGRDEDGARWPCILPKWLVEQKILTHSGAKQSSPPSAPAQEEISIKHAHIFDLTSVVVPFSYCKP